MVDLKFSVVLTLKNTIFASAPFIKRLICKVLMCCLNDKTTINNNTKFLRKLPRSTSLKIINPPGINFTFLMLYFNIFKERRAPTLTAD